MSDDKMAAKEVGDALQRALADGFVFAAKARNASWNIQGGAILTMRDLLAEMALSEWCALDRLADRIRALGRPVRGAPEEIAPLSSISGRLPLFAGDDIMRGLLTDVEIMCETLVAARDIASDNSDGISAALADDRLGHFQDLAWKIRAYLS